MENYDKQYRGNFSYEDFMNYVHEAKKSIIKNNNLEVNAFNNIRHSTNIGYTINLEEFAGEYLTDEIIKDDKIIGHLNYFFDNRKQFIEISTHSI